MLIIQLHLSALICLLSKCALAISPSAAALNEPVASIQASIADNGGLDTEGTDTLDGTSLKAVEPGLSTEEVVASSIPKSAWTATADSSQPGFPATNVLDENLDTMWHTTFLESGVSLFALSLLDLPSLIPIGTASA